MTFSSAPSLAHAFESEVSEETNIGYEVLEYEEGYFGDGYIGDNYTDDEDTEIDTDYDTSKEYYDNDKDISYKEYKDINSTTTEPKVFELTGSRYENGWFIIEDPTSAANLITQINELLDEYHGQTNATRDYSAVRRLRLIGATSATNLFNTTNTNPIRTHLVELDMRSLDAPNNMPIIAVGTTVMVPFPSTTWTGYTSLQHVVMPTTVTNAAVANGFRNATNLRSVTFPGDVTNFGANDFFNGCQNLVNIIFESYIAPTIHAATFNNSNNAIASARIVRAFVPDTTMGGYELSEFTQFFSSVRNIGDGDEPLNKDALNDLITYAQVITADDYTAVSRNVFQSALSRAIAVAESSDVIQDEVNRAYDNLRVAIDGLRPYWEEWITIHNPNGQLLEMLDEILNELSSSYGSVLRLKITGTMHVSDFIGPGNPGLLRTVSGPLSASSQDAVAQRTPPILSGLRELDFAGVTNITGNTGAIQEAFPTAGLIGNVNLESIRFPTHINFNANLIRGNLNLRQIVFGDAPFREDTFDFRGYELAAFGGNFGFTTAPIPFPAATTPGFGGPRTIIFPANVAVNNDMFRQMQRLEEVIFEGSVPSIGTNVFLANANLHTVHFYGETAPIISNINAFNNITPRPVAIVPTVEIGSGFETAAFQNNFSAVIPRAGGIIDILDLQAAIGYAESRIEAHYTAESWEAMQESLVAARAEVINLLATQATIDAAADVLRSALEALVVREYLAAFISVPEGARVGVFQPYTPFALSGGIYQYRSFVSASMSLDEERTEEAAGRDVWRVVVPNTNNPHWHIEAYIPGVTIKHARAIGSPTPGAKITMELTLLSEWIPVNSAVHNANMYTNADKAGTVNLSEGERFALDTFRVQQGGSDFLPGVILPIQPEFSFEVFGDSIEVSRIGSSGRERLEIVGTQAGTSVIKITYSPMILESRAGATQRFDAIASHNIGTVVVNVDGGVDFDTGIAVDNDFDTYYFDQTIGYREFTFTPAQGTSVRVHSPLATSAWGSGWTSYTADEDETFTVVLREGRNVIELRNGGSVRYHVIMARGVSVTVTNVTSPGQPFSIGNQARIEVRGIEEPVELMAVIYNPGFAGWSNHRAFIQYSNGSEYFTSNRAPIQYRARTATFTVYYTLNDLGSNVLSGQVWVGHFGQSTGRGASHVGNGNPYISASAPVGHRSINPNGFRRTPGGMEAEFLPTGYGSLPIIVLPLAGQDVEPSAGEITFLPSGADALAPNSTLVIKNETGEIQPPISSVYRNVYILPMGIGFTYFYSVRGYLVSSGMFDVTRDAIVTMSAPVPHNQQAGTVNVTVVTHNSIARDRHVINFVPDEGINLHAQGHVTHNNGGYTVLHAIIETLNASTAIGFDSNRGLLTIHGTPVGTGFWVVEVNGMVIPADELASRLVSDEDDIRFYFSPTADAQYLWFEESQISVQQGENVRLRLLGKPAGMDGLSNPVAGATIRVNPYIIGTTDANGYVVIPAERLLLGTDMNIIRASLDTPFVYNRAVITVTRGTTGGPIGGPGSPDGRSSVTFRLIGAARQAEPVGFVEGHVEYQNWIRTVTYSFDEERVSVSHVFSWALRNAGLGYQIRGGNYVTAIQAPAHFGGHWLSEFDNGPMSGWKYKVNGTHPTLGINELYVAHGDTIIWHYIHDLGLETSWSGNIAQFPNAWMMVPDVDFGVIIPPNLPPLGSGSVGTEPDVSIVIEGEPIIDGNTARVVISDTQVLDTLDRVIMALRGDESAELGEIRITTGTQNNITTVATELTVRALRAIANEGNMLLTIETNISTLTFDSDALASMTYGMNNNAVVQIIINRLTTDKLLDEHQDIIGDNEAFELKVLVNGNPITNFGNSAITIMLAYELEDGVNADNLKVFHLSQEGVVSEMTDTKYDEDLEGFVFTVSHLGIFFIAEVRIEAIEDEREEYEEEPISTLEWINPFIDVNEEHWFYSAVGFAYINDLVRGTTANTFSPDMPLTRAMLVTILYRYEGEPAVMESVVFSDVALDQWYSQAIIWASENGIVWGFGDGTFGAHDTITREQFAVIMYRYAQLSGADTLAVIDLTSFEDVGEVSSWALGAMGWANANGLITGRTLITLAPDGRTTRAEAAVMLQRFIFAKQ